MCSDCREALRECESVVNDAIPAIGAEQVSRIDPGPKWSQSKAEKTFFERLEREKKEGWESPAAQKENGVPYAFRRPLPTVPESTWRHIWMLYATGILLFVTLCLSAYWVGVRRGTDVTKSTPLVPASQRAATAQTAGSLEEELGDAAHEREIARTQITERHKALADLRRQLQQ